MDEAKLRKAFADLRARVAYLETVSGLFASDKDLDGQYGDPKIKFAPRGWRGHDYKGRPMSECPPEFLEMLAESLAYSADNPKEGKQQYASMNRRDAARARTWARRIRSGVSPPPAAARAIANGVPAPEAVAAPDVDAPHVEAPQIDEPSFDEPSDADEDAELPTF